MKKTIAVLEGDGIGPEVTAEAVMVIKKIAKEYGHTFIFRKGLIGVEAFKKTGEMLPKETLTLCEEVDAILFGTIGDPEYDHLRPEESLLKIRSYLGLFSNLRPIYVFPHMPDISPLKKEIINNCDFIIVRELTGGIYYGKRKKTDNSAYDTSSYTKEEILRVSEIAFELALTRKSKITVVDKANVLDTSRLWRETVTSFAKKYPEIILDFLYVDNASMQIIKRPASFDVILTENMFGDILSDEASVIGGSLGMIPSASLGGKTALYEPIHGSYPKAKGLNTANPVGSILSAAMMLEISFNLKKERDVIYDAVSTVLSKGFGTKDIFPTHILSTTEFGKQIRDEIKR